MRLTRPYPGVLETLEVLAGMGLTFGVVTNKPYAATMEVLDALAFIPFFATVVGGDSAVRRKPHPDPVLKVVADAGLTPAETIMVGDNYHGVEAAYAAGLCAIIVTYGYSHKPPARVGANYVIDAMPAILPIIRQQAVLKI